MERKTIQELHQRYVQYCLVIRNYSPITVKGYKDTMKVFLRETGIVYPQQATKDVFEKWFFEGRLNRKWSPVTYRHHLKRLNTFFDWLKKENIIEFNHASQIEKPRLEHKLPRTVSKDQAQLILDASYHMRYYFRFERFRNRGVIGMMILAGLRKREVLQLKLQDVSMETRMVFIHQGKGHKDRMVPINFKLYDILSEYLKEREKLKRESLFFFTQIGKDAPIGDNSIKLLIRRLRRKTNVDFSAHTLRHGFARLMLEGGCDIYTLSKIMGHNKITTTTIYLSCSSQQMSKSIEMHSLN